ncbi:MAG: MASE1 domain-containing protein, partial [Candidatus Eisenbacteria bacterium]|nr:MASE1 domain-containing protein [Candidatus Eisenbacteria bacterium]
MTSARPGRRPTGWEAALWFAGYLAMGAAVYFLQGDIEPVLWYPPIAIGTAALLTFGWRALPLLYLADFLVTWPKTPVPLSAPLISAAGTTLECAVAFALLRRAGVTSAMSRARDVPLAVLLAGCVATVTGATFGTLLALSTGVPLRFDSPLLFWFNWWLCDTTSMVVLLPALLMWLAPSESRDSRPEPGGALERVALVVATALLSLGGLMSPQFGENRERIPWLGLGVSIVMWAATRFSRRVTAATVAVLAAAAFGVVRGEFLLAEFSLSHIMTTLHTVQLDVTLMSMGGLALNSLISRERRVRRELESTA